VEIQSHFVVPEDEIIACTSIARKIAQHFLKDAPPITTVDDLTSACHLGLLRAARTYRNVNGAPFEAYAVYVMKMAARRELIFAYRYMRRFYGTPDSYADSGDDNSFLENAAANSSVRPSSEKQKKGRAASENLDLLSVVYGNSDPFNKPLQSILLQIALKQLDNKKQLVLDLYYNSLIPLRMIGKRLGIGEASIRKSRNLALCQLRCKLITDNERLDILCTANHNSKSYKHVYVPL
jgi:RNA polymerase sigma factor (sigma-70 family)